MALKYANNIRRSKDKFGKIDRKVRISFDKIMLQMFIGYLSLDSKYITRANYINMKKLIEIIDMSMYESDIEKYSMLQFISLMLEARVDKNMENITVILSYCTSTGNERFVKLANSVKHFAKIKEKEIRYINRAVIDRLKYSYIVFYKDIIFHDLGRIDSGDFNSFEEISMIVKEDITRLLSEMRGAESLNSLDVFSLDDDVFDTVVRDVSRKLKDKSRVFKTGIKALNKILSGGFHSGRLYMFLGISGGFKSGLLLTVAKWMKLMNPEMRPKRNPEATPAVLFISNENALEETVERVFNMTVPNVDIASLTPEELIHKLRTEGKMSITDENGTDLIFRFYRDREIDTNDLYGIIEDIENNGKEVVSLVLDYIKRIKATESGHGDERIELKNASNELKSLAQNLDIPVVTAMQINRAGNANIEMGMTQSKKDLARFVGATNIANCWDLVENSDWVCIINKEKRQEDGRWYLTFKRTKIRYRDESDGATYFNHPFANDDAIALIDDFYLNKSLSLSSLANDNDDALGAPTLGRKGRTSAKKRKEVYDETDEEFLELEKFSSKTTA